MEKFTQLTGVAAPLDMINVDTDMVIPKQFLKTIGRPGLGPKPVRQAPGVARPVGRSIQ